MTCEVRLAGLTLATVFLLSGCAWNAPLTARGQEHATAIEAIVAKASEAGFGGGSIAKQCEIALDCTPNDLFQYQVGSADSSLTYTQLCGAFFEFAESVSFTGWRRDSHKVEETDTTSVAAGREACFESLSAMGDGLNIVDGEALPTQSEGIILSGVDGSFTPPVVFGAPLNGSIETDGKRGYYFLLYTGEPLEGQS